MPFWLQTKLSHSKTSKEGTTIRYCVHFIAFLPYLQQEGLTNPSLGGSLSREEKEAMNHEENLPILESLHDRLNPSHPLEPLGTIIIS